MASVGNYTENPAGACIKVMASFSSGLCSHRRWSHRKHTTTHTKTSTSDRSVTTEAGFITKDETKHLQTSLLHYKPHSKQQLMENMCNECS